MRANGQKELLTEMKYDPVAAFKTALNPNTPWDSIVDFATHRSFCGLRLYPRQITLLRLIYLETEHMTAYDLDVIEQWRQGFMNPDAPEGIQQDIWQRIEYLKQRGYRHFPHIEAIIGRRGSKGKIGGVLGAEKLAYMFSLGDWQSHYGVSPGKDGFLSVVAVNSIQAKKFQFADIRETVENCVYLQRSIATSKEYELTLRTPADLARIAYLHKNKIPIDHQIASLHAIAMSSNSASGRGATGFANFYDEFAHMITGTGSQRSSEEIYEAYQPSLDQFGQDSLTYIPSSPFCLAPETPVLTEDLRWVPVGDLELGDKLVGFDEHDPGGRGNGRTWQSAQVTHTEVIQAPRYRITTESGKRIVSTGEHLWLAKASPGIGQGNGRGSGRPPGISQRFMWVKTSELISGDNIKSLGVDPWEEDNSRDAGYLAGFFDGEGHFSTTGIGLTQNRGLVLDKVTALLKERGFDMSDYTPEAKLSKPRMRGGWPEVLRFLGTVRPERLLDKFTDRFYGGRIYGNAKTGDSADRVVSIERVEDGPVVALATSTHTLIADGLLSHNTQIGHFYSLYNEGKVLMSTYDKDTQTNQYAERTVRQLGHSEDGIAEKMVEMTANPEMLVVQLPSWGLYEDWRKSPKLGGPLFKRPIQAYDERMMRLERSNPQKFNVERRCLDPNTRVLGADLQWHRIADLVVGQELVGVDEEAPHDGLKQRRMRTTTVEALAVNRQVAYRITFEDGSSVVCSGNHRWLSASNSGGFRWRSLRAQEGNAGPRTGIRVGDRIRRICDTWEPDNTRGAGYLAGMYDGEGHVSCRNRSEFLISYTQSTKWNQDVIDETVSLLKDRGFSPDFRWGQRDEGNEIESHLIRGFSEVARFVGSIGGVKMRRQAIPHLWEGRGLPKPRMGQVAKRIAAIEELPEQELVDIQTSTRTFIAEGLVSHNSQFATVIDAFMDPRKVEQMFDPVPWREELLVPQDRGRVDRQYYAHIDPGLTNANFAFAIGHLEYAPADDEGDVWPHVIIDFLKVWKPEDYDDHTIDYVQVQRELAATLRKFPSMKIFSADQWNSAGMLAALREEFSPGIEIKQEAFTEVYNQERMDRMKSAVNLGWVHSYADNFYGDGDCLLELEMKFLQKKGKRVDKQEFGPVTTKDLFDAVNVVTDRLLKDDLDRWQRKMLGIHSPAVGSSNVAGLRSGRDLDRLNALKSSMNTRRGNDNMTPRQKLQELSRDRGIARRSGAGGTSITRLRGR